jgi:hypothetical protein
MNEAIQHVVVTLVALGAGGVLARRVFGFFAPPAQSAHGCASCASGTGACAPRAAAPPAAGQPVVFIRQPESPVRTPSARLG